MEAAIFNDLHSLVQTVIHVLAIASVLSACSLVLIGRAR